MQHELDGIRLLFGNHRGEGALCVCGEREGEEKKKEEKRDFEV